MKRQFNVLLQKKSKLLQDQSLLRIQRSFTQQKLSKNLDIPELNAKSAKTIIGDIQNLKQHVAILIAMENTHLLEMG